MQNTLIGNVSYGVTTATKDSIAQKPKQNIEQLHNCEVEFGCQCSGEEKIKAVQ